MKKSKFSDQQIAFALQQAKTGTSVGDGRITAMAGPPSQS